MSQKKKKTDDKPQEEFRNDKLRNKEVNPPDQDAKRGEQEEENYDEWTLEQLQIEAQRQGLEEGMTMDKEQLIQKLRGG